uniref:CHK kinase-like domain-containing protein n=1 Tax=Strongyloides stercoralis TaxID=6248 RepID=A0A0K0EBD9_STRER
MEELVEKIKNSIRRERLCDDIKELQWRSLDLNLDNCLNRICFISKIIDKRYLVYLTRKIDFDKEKPEQIELASIGVVYNMRYIFQLLEAKRRRLKISYGSGHALFSYKKDDIDIDCFCIESSNLYPLNDIKINTLEVEKILSVARYVAKFQVSCMRWIGDSSKRCIIFNNKYLLTFLNDQLINYQPTYIESLEKYMRKYFKNPDKMIEQVKYYLKTHTTFDKLEEKKYFKLLPLVISHSFLCPEVINFKNSNTNEVVEIEGWHYTTFMPVGYDIISLIINSLDSKVRIERYKYILMSYYEVFIKYSTQHFEFKHLLEYYKASIKYVVFRNLHKLLTMLSSDNISYMEKKVIAQRWEDALDEAYYNEYYEL